MKIILNGKEVDAIVSIQNDECIINTHQEQEKQVNSWEDLENINGYMICVDSRITETLVFPMNSENRNVFLKEKYAKSALAMAQISQLLPYYGGGFDFNRVNYCLVNYKDEIAEDASTSEFKLLAFPSREKRARFLKYNEQLVKDYLMITEEGEEDDK